MTIGAEEFVRLASEHNDWARSYGGNVVPRGSKLILHDSKLSDIGLRAIDLSSCEIIRCTITNAKFEDCDFMHAMLIESQFENCFFVRKAELQDADCHTSGFMKSDLSRADLTDANFFSASLVDCSFAWAWLINTDMREAILDGTEFSNAKLSGTKLYNSRRYRLGSTKGAVVKNVDFSREGNESLLMGDEVFQHLQIS